MIPKRSGFFAVAVFFGLGADVAEEGAEDGAAFAGEESGVDGGLVVESGVSEEVHERAHASGFGVECAEVDFGDPGKDDGAGAHGAGFEGDVEARVFETPGTAAGGGGGDGDDFGVGGGVLEGFALVVAFADDAVLVHDDAADGHFAGVAGAFGLLECGAHIAFVFGLHGGGLCVRAGREVKGRLKAVGTAVSGEQGVLDGLSGGVYHGDEAEAGIEVAGAIIGCWVVFPRVGNEARCCP